MSADQPAPDNVFEAIFQAEPDGVLLVDPQGVIVLANQAAADLLGYADADLIGIAVDALVPVHLASGHAAHRHAFNAAPRSRPMGTDLELTALRADGSEVHVEIALSPLTAPPGHAHRGHVVASVRGVGAYPRVQRAMRRSRYSESVAQLARLAVDARDTHFLLKQLPALAVSAIDADVVAVFLLSADQQQLHVATYGGIGDTDRAAMTQANRPDTPCGHVLALGKPVVVDDFRNESRFAVPSGMLALGARSGLAVPLIDRGKAIGVLALWSIRAQRFGSDEVAFLESLSNLLATSLQRAQIEAQLNHAQRLETVGQLTGGIAHDFNNLLTVVLGNLQMLADHAAIDGNAMAQQLVRTATRASQRGAELTRKLLAFSRRQALDPVVVDPLALLESLADMLRRTLGERIRIQLHLERPCPSCLADVVQLESALLNVAVNARDAMPEGGTLTLSCRAEELPTVDGATAEVPLRRSVVFEVSDTGTGMSQEVLDRAFEPFFTTKAAGRGTGLGLATVYGFVTQSGGDVRILSAEGMGTRVRLLLPALDDAAQVAPDATPPVTLPSLQGLRVLLVEDDAAVRAVTQAFLVGFGCLCVAHATAVDALAALEHGVDFDLLITDLSLGEGLDGSQLAHRARAMAAGLKVLLVSGDAAAVACDPGALALPLLNKPFDRDTLATAIGAVLTKVQAPPG